jgi:hypothetical protein
MFILVAAIFWNSIPDLPGAKAEPFVAGQFIQTPRAAHCSFIAHQSGGKSARCPVVESRF